MLKRIAVMLLLIILTLALISCSSDPEPVDPPLEGEITDLASEFIDNLVKEDYSAAAAFFDAQMKKAMSEKKLKQTWEGLLKQMGAYVGEVDKRVEQSGEYEAVNVISEYTSDPLNIRVVFNSDKRVSGLWFQPVE